MGESRFDEFCFRASVKLSSQAVVQRVIVAGVWHQTSTSNDFFILLCSQPSSPLCMHSPRVASREGLPRRRSVAANGLLRLASDVLRSTEIGAWSISPVV